MFIQDYQGVFYPNDIIIIKNTLKKPKPITDSVLHSSSSKTTLHQQPSVCEDGQERKINQISRNTWNTAKNHLVSSTSTDWTYLNLSF